MSFVQISFAHIPHSTASGLLLSAYVRNLGIGHMLRSFVGSVGYVCLFIRVAVSADSTNKRL